MKVDFTQSLDSYRARSGEVRVLEAPPMQYHMVDGKGDPNTASAYAGALEVLYPAAYMVKFVSKRELNRDYVVPELEVLWWAPDMAAFTSARDETKWHWTALIGV